MKTIKAKVMYQWNRKQNPRCKFVPGDEVFVKYVAHNSNPAEKYKGKYGRVEAVTTTDGKAIRGPSPTGRCDRMFTRYYVRFNDGEVFGFHSQCLVTAEAERKRRELALTQQVTEIKELYTIPTNTINAPLNGKSIIIEGDLYFTENSVYKVEILEAEDD